MLIYKALDFNSICCYYEQYVIGVDPLVSQAKYLNKLSSNFFLFSFLIGKLKSIPIALASSIFNIASLVLGFIGYSFWFLATYFYPNSAPSKDKWYGFSEISEQQKISAMYGLVATTLGVLGIAFPIILIPSAWLFVTANIYWVISEYHKLNTPPKDDPNYNPKAQSDYITYAIVMTSIGLLTAVTTTLAICFPPIAVPVLAASSILGTGLGVLAFEYWLKMTFAPDPEKEAPTLNTSYNQAIDALGTNANTQTPHSAPYQEKDFLNKQVKTSDEPEIKSSCMNKL